MNIHEDNQAMTLYWHIDTNAIKVAQANDIDVMNCRVLCPYLLPISCGWYVVYHRAYLKHTVILGRASNEEQFDAEWRIYAPVN